MRLLSLSFGVLAILSGLVQWFWVSWAFGASWHLGSPIRQHRIGNNATEGTLHSLVEEVYSTGLRVIGVLEDTLNLVAINGLLFVAIGIVLIVVSNKLKLDASATVA